MDWLGDRLAACYEDGAANHLKAPWEARDNYIDVVLDRSEENVAAFLLRHSLHPLDEDATVAVLCLLEMQRHAMLMYTSCGWFFDELTGLETVQILQYAGRAMQLAERYCIQGVETAFLERLALAGSNIPEQGNGADSYAAFVEPAKIDLIKVGAHYAVSSVFEEYGEDTGIFSYRASREDLVLLDSGQMRLAVGRIFIRSAITRKAGWMSFSTLYFGGHALNCGVRSFLGEEPYLAMKQEVVAAFKEGDFAAIIRLMDTHFGMHTYSLKDLFRDEQRHILHLIISGTLQEFEDKFITLYDKSRNLMGFLRETGMPVPHRFLTTAETALNLRLQQMFTADTVDVDRLEEVLGEIKEWNAVVDRVALEFIIRRRLEGAMAALLAEPDNSRILGEVRLLVESMAALPVVVNLWHVQNMYWGMLQSRATEFEFEDGGANGGGSWSEAVKDLGHLLYFNMPAVLAAAKGTL